MFRERLAGWAFAPRRRGCRCRRLDFGFLRRQLILGGACFQVFQLQFELLQEPAFTLGTAAIKRTPQLLDLQSEMGDQRIRAGGNGFSFDAGSVLGEDHRVSAGKVGRERIKA